MNTRTLVALSAVLALGAHARSQLTDQEFIDLVRPYVHKFANEEVDRVPRVFREEVVDVPGGATQSVVVGWGNVHAYFDDKGNLKSFSNGSRQVLQPKEGVNRYTHSQAWVQFERIVANFIVPEEITVRTIQELSGVGEPFALRIRKAAAAPGGFQSEWGNYVSIDLHRSTGRLISIRIVDGWTFEPPNVQTSSDFAREAVRARHGGNLDDHSATLKYTTVADKNAPAYSREMRRDKVLRLHYLVTNRATKGFAMVDAVTGDVVSYQVLTPSGSPSTPIEDASEAKSPLESRETPSQSKVESSSSVRESTRRRSPLPFVLASVVALAVLGMLIILAKARK